MNASDKVMFENEKK